MVAPLLRAFRVELGACGPPRARLDIAIAHAPQHTSANDRDIRKIRKSKPTLHGLAGLRGPPAHDPMSIILHTAPKYSTYHSIMNHHQAIARPMAFPVQEYPPT